MRKSADEAYWMSHRPTREGGPAYNLLEGDPEWNNEPRYPPDIYDKPQYYTGFSQGILETMATLRAARGNPNAMITIYRAQKDDAGLNTGDWVSLSRGYAQSDLDSGSKGESYVRALETYRVRAKDVIYAGDDLMEWGYWGRKIAKTGALAVEASEEHSDDVMLCLMPSEALRDALAGMEECTQPVEELHLTLRYLGDALEDCGGEMGRERLYRAVYDFVLHAGYRGLTGVLNGFGCFLNEDGNALVGLLDIPGIAEFRASLMGYLDRHGFEPRQDNHGLTPHMTLAVSDTPPKAFPSLPSENPDRVVFTSVWIVWGEEWQEVQFL